VEGQNVHLDVRESTRGIVSAQEIVAEFVRLPVDILVTPNTVFARVARDAAEGIPIVMARSGVDPVTAGLATSLARPGGNVTGLTAITQELSGKRLELLRETRPSIERVAALWNATTPEKAIELREVEAFAVALGLTLQSLELRTPSDLDGALDTALRAHADALIALEDGLIVSLAHRIVDFAIQSGMPTVSEGRSWAEAGGLLVYGVSVPEMFRRSAAYVDKILKGAKPADLPIERPMRFDFVINLRTAQALGLTIPPHVLLQATELIQ
jgi:putative ABC transport system substrate-binding protein